MPAHGAVLDAIHTPVVTPTVSEIYRAHADLVWRAVQRLGVPPAEAEDVVHEVFLVVQRRLPEFDGRALTSWLYAISRGMAANYRRGRSRAMRRVEDLEPPPPTRSPEEDAIQREAVAAVGAFLAELDKETRAVFELCDIEGMAGPEVARALGLELPRVYARLKTARRRFNAFVARRTP